MGGGAFYAATNLEEKTDVALLIHDALLLEALHEHRALLNARRQVFCLTGIKIELRNSKLFAVVEVDCRAAQRQKIISAIAARMQRQLRRQKLSDSLVEHRLLIDRHFNKVEHRAIALECFSVDHLAQIVELNRFGLVFDRFDVLKSTSAPSKTVRVCTRHCD